MAGENHICGKRRAIPHEKFALIHVIGARESCKSCMEPRCSNRLLRGSYNSSWQHLLIEIMRKLPRFSDAQEPYKPTERSKVYLYVKQE